MCTVHMTVHRLSCYMNIPKCSKLFVQIVRETSVRESDCLGNVRYPFVYLYAYTKCILRNITNITKYDVRMPEKFCVFLFVCFFRF